MTTREQNDFLTQAGPGTPIGNLFRRYWIPALLLERSAGARLPAGARQVLSERLLAFRDTPGARRRDRRVLRAPRRVALVRAQRGERVALLLPWLEIRCERAMHRGAVGAAGERVLQQDQADVLSLRRAGDVIWIYMGPADTSRHCLPSNGQGCRIRIASCRSAPRSAITCRRWRAGSIPRMSRFFIATNSQRLAFHVGQGRRAERVKPTRASRWWRPGEGW